MDAVSEVKFILRRLGFDDIDFKFMDAYNLYCIDKDYEQYRTNNALDISNVWWLERIMGKNFHEEEALHYFVQYFNASTGDDIEHYRPRDENGYRPRKVFSSQGKPEPKRGFVYIAYSDSMPDMVKVGYTTNSIETRMKQLSPRTSVPSPFRCLWRCASDDCVLLEKYLHKELSDYQVGGSEFFNIDAERAIRICISVSQEFK